MSQDELVDIVEYDKEKRPKVGIGAIVRKGDQYLLGKRIGTKDHQEYAAPGGWLEHMESIEDCAKREVLEETGMEVENVQFLFTYNMKDYAPEHLINIAVLCEWKSGEPQTMEPEKCEGWAWYSLDNLPQPLYKSWPHILEAIKTGRNYFDS